SADEHESRHRAQARQFKDNTQSLYEKTGRRSDTNRSPKGGLIHFNSSAVLPQFLQRRSTVSGLLLKNRTDASGDVSPYLSYAFKFGRVDYLFNVIE
ncbi:MAG: hypothetical protein OSB55_12730, partial [Verrucomicrobiota bacterium]|nr:hypothetical protein [Verrucomicrobiota bacterium]